MKKIQSDNYQILIGKNILKNLDLKSYSKIAVLVDEKTFIHCLPILINENQKLKQSTIIKIKGGEKHKTINTVQVILKELVDKKFNRKSILINLGGGIIGDIGGFCASIYKRGINYIHIPTSLLAMVDASIGGKVGVNQQYLKNNIGLFSNPVRVIIDTTFLKTLPKKEMHNGFAEVLKHALIADKNLWNKIIKTDFDLLEWEEIIKKSVEIKNTIVCSDPNEKNLRKKLNFAHTYAHAIESYYLQKNNPISHGEAVYIGIMLESELSEINNEEKIQIKNYILSNFKLPLIPSKNKLLKFLIHDKKNLNELINFSLLTKIGECTIDKMFSINEL